jgi:NAD+ synthase
MNTPIKLSEVEIISAFITNSFKNAKKTKAIIAVSGGVDSATSLLLLTKVLKPENVYTLHLPAKNSHPLHTKHSALINETAGIPASNRLTIPIGGLIQKTWRLLSRHSVGANPRIRPESNPNNRLRLANIAARIRMIILFDQAKKRDALVIGTENYSEHLLGYYTRYGDEASDIEPIRHLYKTEVIELAKHLGVPPEIIIKPPSADLWKSQTDEKELGFSYQQADPILKLYSEGKTKAQISTFHQSELVEKVFSQIEISAFKHHVPYHL